MSVEQPGAADQSKQLLPLSFAQQRLWFLHQLQPDSAAYHALDAVRLRGCLNLPALQASLNSIMARHEVLRTRFVQWDGEPMAEVAADGSWPLTRIDLQGMSADDQHREIRRLADECQHRSCDLARGPLVDATLIVLASDDHVLFLRLHHIVADGWSIGILRHELAAMYGAFAKGNRSSLPRLPCQYGDFATWQRAWLTEERLQSQLDYWRRRLRDLPTLNLPTDRPRPAQPSDRGGAVVRELPRALLDAVNAVSHQTQSTLYMVLLAAFQVLLSRYTEQTDFAIGTPVANRLRQDWEGLIGFFVNTLVMRADLAGDPTFRDYVRQVRDRALEAYSYQDLPFEVLVQELSPERDIGRNPLFQVTFGVHNLAPTEWQLSDLEVGPVDFEVTTSRFDLELNLWEHPQGLRVVAFYNEELFDRSTMQRLLQHFERLLQGIAASPDRRLSELPLLTDAERRSLLVTWNRPPDTWPEAACLHELFQAQAARSPDRVALSMGDTAWTYDQLAQRSSDIAARLREWGVGAEVPVALCLNRSPEMVAAILGVLQCGGAYVPMEPDVPQERQAFLLQECGAPVIVTESALRPLLPRACQALVYCWDSDEVCDPMNGRRRTAPRGPSPDNLAYLMYTSGSSGRPKAVQITHRNIVRLFQATQPTFQFGADDVWTMFHSFAFDFSVWEIWGALLFGGRLEIVPWEICRSPVEFQRLLESRQVTVLNQTPTAFGQLMQETGQLHSPLPSLRWIIFGGEKLEPHHLAGWYARSRNEGTRLANMYGITETSVHTTLQEVTASLVQSGPIPIGHRLSDLQIYVLDSHGQVVPPGVPGEICVGGAGLARGYWGDVRLTADKFRPHPYSREMGARLYRTGDRGRFRSDGTLEYLGRADAQVKVRGVRIEPGEIEVALRQLPRVRDALVTATEATAGEWRLVAYVVPADGCELAVDDIQRELRRWLPPALIPSAFVTLRELPRTVHGKIDRQALPRPESARPALSVRYVPPRTPIERGIAEIWQETLGLENLGAHDHFFDLGGHSLQATRVVARVREAFGVAMPLQRLFANPVLADFASQVEGALTDQPAAPMPPLLPGRRRVPPRLSFAQQRLFFLCQLQPGSGAYHVPMVVEFVGRLDIDALRRSLNALVQRHESLRTTFPMVNGSPVQEIAASGRCPLAVEDWRSIPGTRQEQLLRECAVREQELPFDLATGPLLRASLLRLQDDRSVLLLTMHHIVSDGWSLGVLRRELADFYGQIVDGRPAQLPPLAVQYADFAEWQRSWLDGEVLQNQLEYWRRQLADLSTLRLPTDRPRSPVGSERGGAETLRLPQSLRQALTRLNRQEGTTLFITLLAAFQLLLARYSQQTDIVVGSPVANRGNRPIEDLIGFFVNTLVLRARCESRLSFRELLQQVRQTALAAFSHQDLPFERLVEELQPDRVLDSNPLFQVMFAVQNAPWEELRLPGLEVRSLHYPVTTTRFDLQWDVIEQSGDLHVVAYYRQQLFDRETIRQMLRHYAALLECVTAEPDRRLYDVSMMADDERQESIRGNETARPFPRDKCVHELFGEIAAGSPNSLAVISDEHRLTYAQLDRRSKQLARRLRQLGVGCETPVGLCVEGSCDLVVAMLGILRAGGAYVPLDPTLPPARLRSLIDLAGIKFLVVSHAGGRMHGEGLEVLDLASCSWSENTDDRALESATPNVLADGLACVMYTSGSTGIPKGIAITHRSIVRLVVENDYVHITAGDTVAQASNPSFDAVTFEIWGALLAGARLVITSRDVLLSPARLDVHLRQHGISIMFLTTALFNELTRDNPARFQSLRCLLFGGEVVDPVQVRRVVAAGPPHQLLHMYGPTECTTFATYSPVEEVAEDAVTVPIGHPIANTQVLLLDADLQPVPRGLPGELYVGGDGLARGYWRDPARTAEQFVPHPFSSQPGARLYRTGDIACYRPSGGIRYLGRRDDQIKLRGFRIELGEIRNALREHPHVRECHLEVDENAPGGRRLVAYVTPERSSTIDDVQQRNLLEDWRQFYDDLYRGADRETDPRFNLVGWTSSYTGRPLSALAMREQVDQTVERVLRHRPRKVLEIGAGTGLLLFRIAPQCEHYWATDISPVVIEQLRQEVFKDSALRHVELSLGSADQLPDLPPGGVDLVILNSVVQYFPSIEYLRRVLIEVARTLRPGGVIFLGDVRNYCLWEAFHTTVELLRAPRSLTVAEVRQRVAFEMEQETELLVHPAFFRSVLADLSGDARVHIEPKRGSLQNELTQFRYDVTIRLGGAEQVPAVDPWQDWSEQPLSLAAIRDHLRSERPELWGLRNVANARVSTAVEAVRALRESRLSAGDLRDRLFQRTHQPDGLDPEELWKLARELDYEVEIDWSEGSIEGRFHVVWRRLGGWRSAGYGRPSAMPAAQDEAVPEFGNRPLRDRVAVQFARQLREHLKQRLPEYMIPSSFMLLDRLPLTSRGKLDRSRLPPPKWTAPSRTTVQQRPLTKSEATIAEIWCEVLRVSQVGLHDNFFDLGGHSLLAMQVVTRLREKFSVDLPVRGLFQAPTVADLALLLTQQRASQVDERLLLEQLEELEGMTDEQIRDRFAGGSGGNE